MFHILLVEDNEADILLVREAIRRSNVDADVLIARDGDQALNSLDESQPDLIIMDLNLPKFTGFDLLERYRLKGGAPVIVLTSSNNDADRARAQELGATDYIVKPVGFHNFVDCLRDVVNRWFDRGETDATAEAAEVKASQRRLSHRTFPRRAAVGKRDIGLNRHNQRNWAWS